MTQAEQEILRPPQEPVVKMTGDVRVEEIQAILGPGETDWFRRELFLLDYPEIDIRLSWEVQDGSPLKLRSLSIGGKLVMELKDTAVALDISDGLVTFVEAIFDGYAMTGFTLSTKLKSVGYFDRDMGSVPAGSRLVYSVQAVNLATEKLKERVGER